MDDLFKKTKIDIILLIPMIIVSFIGLLMVYSASNVIGLEKYNDQFYFFKRQLVFYIVGIILSIFIIKIDINKIKKHTALIFLICLILLIAVLIPGIGVLRGGARSWINLGIINIQPSETMKVALVLVYAKYLSNYNQDLQKFKFFIFTLSLSIIIFGIIMLQPDFGTGLVILLSSLIILYLAGAKLIHFSIIAVIGVIGFAILIISAPYRIERIISFLDPWSDPLGSGFQGIQSLFAITPGGIFGHGFNSSMQKHFFLPEPQNDFIFAIYIEEFGLIGGILLIALYLIILIRAMIITSNLNNKYLEFLSSGIIVSFFIQIIINIFVVIGLLPVTGITLPLMSYGGSSLIISMISLSILLNISKYRSPLLK